MCSATTTTCKNGTHGGRAQASGLCQSNPIGSIQQDLFGQMAVAISCETAKGLQSRLKVPRSPALQPLVGADRPWWITLPSNTVSEFMIAPTRLQLMLCPPENEGHIPPVISVSFLQQLPDGAVCCGTEAAQKIPNRSEVLGPLRQ